MQRNTRNLIELHMSISELSTAYAVLKRNILGRSVVSKIVKPSRYILIYDSNKVPPKRAMDLLTSPSPQVSLVR